MNLRNRTLMLRTKRTAFYFTFTAVAFCLFFTLSAVQGSAEGEKIAAPPSDSQSDQDMERILATLNETLRENRELRDNMNVIQQTIEKVTVQSNVQMQQIREMETKVKDAEAQKNEALAKIENWQKQIKDLEKEKQEIEGRVSGSSDELKKLQEQNEKLQKLVENSILETERAEYEKMLKDAQQSTEKTLTALSQTTTENERIKAELDNAYYRLGNVMFEEKNYEGALQQYKKALEWNPTNSYAHHNLAVIYDFYLNDRPQALYHYRRYLNLKPIEEEALEIRSRVIDLELLKELVPHQPLKVDFNDYHEKK